MKHLPNLYFLRFFLALTVLIYHLPTTSVNIGVPAYKALAIFNKGTVAVFYFFSLSGFLIIRNLYREYLKTGTVSLRSFFARRVRRLWPVYYLIILVGLIIYQLLIPLIGVNYVSDYNVTELLAYYIFLMSNVFNDMHKVGGILNITWSIGVEEQFYLMFPIVLLIFRKYIKVALVILLAILVGILSIYPEFYTFQNFYFYFILGGLLAILAEENKLSFLKSKMLRITILLLFFATFFTNMLVFADMRYNHMVNLVISNLVIVSLAYYPIIILDKLKLNYLGEISYGIYMYHMIVITFYLYGLKYFNIDKYFNPTVLVILNNVVTIAGTLIVSHLSYKYFETLFYRKRYTPPSSTKFKEGLRKERSV